MSTLLCVPIIVHDVTSALAKGARAAELGADLIEWRVDEFFASGGSAGRSRRERQLASPEAADSTPSDEVLQYLAAGEILHLVVESPVPCIVTCRPTWEGGDYDGDEDARIALFERLGREPEREANRDRTGDDRVDRVLRRPYRPPRYIDVELAAYTRSANLRMKVDLAVDHPAQQRELATGLILSIHDFDGPPADLGRRLLTLRDQPAAKVHKIAFRCRTVRDNLELFDILKRRDRPTIALGMGEAGLLSRVLAPKFGGFLTFAALNEQERSAPGQPTITELLNTYRFRSIGRNTRVYGIVGWPVAHSRSPQIHNAGFTAVGHNGVYLPLPVAPGYESFKATILELANRPDLHLTGLSVTLPHKENLARLAREQGWQMDEPTEATGAANTLTIQRDPAGSMIGAPAVANTDATALVAVLAETGPLNGRRVAILGAGGVGRAAVWAAARAGAEVTIYNRTLDRAEKLAAELAGRLGAAGRIAAAPLEAAAAAPHEIYLNATSIGMEGGPAPERSPVDVSGIALPGDGQPDGRPLAIDTVYTPIDTPFLRAAAAAGWRTIDGADLFLRQAALQFEMWTGRPAPRELFDQLARGQAG